MQALKTMPFMFGSPRLNIGQALKEILSTGSLSEETVGYMLIPSQGSRILDRNKKGRGRQRDAGGGMEMEGMQRQAGGGDAGGGGDIEVGVWIQVKWSACRSPTPSVCFGGWLRTKT